MLHLDNGVSHQRVVTDFSLHYTQSSKMHAPALAASAIVDTGDRTPQASPMPVQSVPAKNRALAKPPAARC